MNNNRKIGWMAASLVAICLCAGLGALFVGKIFAMTQPVVDASEQFLSLVGQGKTAEAFACSADGFRAQQDEPSFTRAVKQLELNNYSSVSWHSRQIDNREGTAEGTVTTKNGFLKSITIRLIQENGTWAVAGVRYGGIDLVTISSKMRVPRMPEREHMVAEALLSFNQAVQDKDFTSFYNTLSEIWKKEITPKKLQRVFQEFIDQEINIAPIMNLKPRMTPRAELNDKGMLVLEGHYATRPSQVRFELEYSNETSGWKLSGITVRVGKPDDTDE